MLLLLLFLLQSCIYIETVHSLAYVAGYNGTEITLIALNGEYVSLRASVSVNVVL